MRLRQKANPASENILEEKGHVKYSKTIYFFATLILCILETAILNLITSVLPAAQAA